MGCGGRFAIRLRVGAGSVYCAACWSDILEDSMELRTCSRCLGAFPERDFFSSRLGGVAKTCTGCRTRMKEAAYHRRRTRTRESRRSEWMPKKYGISYADFLGMLEEQGGRCAICATDQPGGKHGWWAVDHDHTSGKVRGLLCNACNVGLGSFRDSVPFLEAAIEYLDRNSV